MGRGQKLLESSFNRGNQLLFMISLMNFLMKERDLLIVGGDS
ncbi:hypothetical protein IC006_0123 [Sulfuracidifex tepidarius]|uniref:Uncharacterized protein n=1 Tax=Sulfuracidifex tepidarius TaxID=1294262 RepID=A0A510DRN2_9CREN|nr:hypothetical protein IC006_0123 [Sulfuracidifex tepidarius]